MAAPAGSGAVALCFLLQGFLIWDSGNYHDLEGSARRWMRTGAGAAGGHRSSYASSRPTCCCQLLRQPVLRFRDLLPLPIQQRPASSLPATAARRSHDQRQLAFQSDFNASIAALNTLAGYDDPAGSPRFCLNEAQSFIVSLIHRSH